MSAQEVIEQIKVLPPDDRRKVIDFVNDTEARTAATDAEPVKPKRDMKAMIKKVFDEHDELFRKLAQ